MKLYVGNLPFSVDDAKLKELFAAYNVAEAVIIKDKFSGRSKGFGFVTIAEDEVAKTAVSEMNGKDVEGRELKVSEAKPMEDRPPRRDFGNRGRSFGGSRGPRRDFNRGPRRDRNEDY
jgi:RNA recognition motif-containing protein